jgi:hypothetical protein
MQASKLQRSRLYNGICCAVLFVVAAAASFNGFYNKYHFREFGIYRFPQSAFDRMVDGTADRPFIYRQMLPQMANFIDERTPDSVKDRLYSFTYAGQQMRELIFESPMARSRAYFFRYVIVYAGTFMFALVAVIAMYFLCQSAGLSPPASVFASVVLILLIPLLMSGGGYFYDYSELAFISLAVFAAMRLDWWWILPIAALGAWNKESFGFVVITLYPLIRQRRSRAHSLGAITVLGLTCALVYLPLHQHFARNPGGSVLLRWKDQLAFVFSSRLFLGHAPLEMTYGVLLPCAAGMVPMALLVWTVWRAWPSLSPPVKTYAQLAGAINLPLYFLFCYPGELRDFSLLYPVLLLMIGINMQRWMLNTDGVA